MQPVPCWPPGSPAASVSQCYLGSITYHALQELTMSHGGYVLATTRVQTRGPYSAQFNCWSPAALFAHAGLQPQLLLEEQQPSGPSSSSGVLAAEWTRALGNGVSATVAQCTLTTTPMPQSSATHQTQPRATWCLRSPSWSSTSERSCRGATCRRAGWRSSTPWQPSQLSTFKGRAGGCSGTTMPAFDRSLRIHRCSRAWRCGR